MGNISEKNWQIVGKLNKKKLVGNFQKITEFFKIKLKNGGKFQKVTDKWKQEINKNQKKILDKKNRKKF